MGFLTSRQKVTCSLRDPPDLQPRLHEEGCGGAARSDTLPRAMSEAAPPPPPSADEMAASSEPPPGANELASAGVPEGGLVAGASQAAPPPLDAKSTRGKRFGALMKNVWALGITWVIAIAALIVVGGQVGFAAGAGAAGVVLVLALIIVYLIASNQAANDFFAAYAEGRGLTQSRRQGKPAACHATPPQG